MVAFHKDFGEYATCSRCGLKKLCGKVGRHMVCWSCAHGNYSGLKNRPLNKYKGDNHD